jgi:hypothetical protein
VALVTRSYVKLMTNALVGGRYNYTGTLRYPIRNMPLTILSTKAVYVNGFVACSPANFINLRWVVCTTPLSFELIKSNSYVIKAPFDGAGLPRACYSYSVFGSDIVCYNKFDIAPGEQLTPTYVLFGH